MNLFLPTTVSDVNAALWEHISCQEKEAPLISVCSDQTLYSDIKPTNCLLLAKTLTQIVTEYNSKKKLINQSDEMSY